ncbi:MAG: hypothetical protein Kow00106_09850 [Anaerolineae bacterium]
MLTSKAAAKTVIPAKIVRQRYMVHSLPNFSSNKKPGAPAVTPLKGFAHRRQVADNLNIRFYKNYVNHFISLSQPFIPDRRAVLTPKKTRRRASGAESEGIRLSAVSQDST